MSTGYMPSSLYRLIPTAVHHHHSFSQKVTVGRAGLCGCKSCTFICIELFVRVFDDFSTFKGHSGAYICVASRRPWTLQRLCSTASQPLTSLDLANSDVTGAIPTAISGFKVHRVRRTRTNSGIVIPATSKQK
ncbi:hypothetical protein TNCV_1611151 [Trichonephila clavipes]|nr:hypothetical protein TNCV_1611151 [Trichonephila clavipes]